MDRRSFLAVSTAIALSPLATLEAKEARLQYLRRDSFVLNCGKDGCVDGPFGYSLVRSNKATYLGQKIQFKVLSYEERIFDSFRDEAGKFQFEEYWSSHPEFSFRKQRMFDQLGEKALCVHYPYIEGIYSTTCEEWSIRYMVETEQGPAFMWLKNRFDITMALLCPPGTIVTHGMRPIGNKRAYQYFEHPETGEEIRNDHNLTKLAIGSARFTSFG